MTFEPEERVTGLGPAVSVVTSRSVSGGEGKTFILAAALLLAGFESEAVLVTVAVLVITLPSAVEFTFTFSDMVAEPPLASVPKLHVTVVLLAEQLP